MAIQHTWKITQMDRFIDTQIVYNVHFAIETIDTDKPPFKMIQNHAVGIPLDTSVATIPYADLTEAQVIQWVKDELHQWQFNPETGELVLDANGKRISEGSLVPAIEADGARQLDELINPKVETAALPWSNV